MGLVSCDNLIPNRVREGFSRLKSRENISRLAGARLETSQLKAIEGRIAEKMRQVYRRIPVYTGDVSGACSALYELGGMVVMHDPSGCNSTYNTHDEIRWYDRDSLIFLSGLDETDAVLGSDERLIHDISEAALAFRPRFIAVVNSPIPYITGQDFEAVCLAVRERTGIPAFYVSTNGMHDYVRGAGLALLRIAELFFDQKDVPGRESGGDGLPRAPHPSAEEFRISRCQTEGGPDHAGGQMRDSHRPCCNLLGVTPLDFAAPSTLQSLRDKADAAGFDVLSCWAMGREGEGPDALLESISASFRADVNLVLSSAGYPAAVYLRQKYGIPFVAGIPAAGTEGLFFEAVRRAVRTGEDQLPFRDRRRLWGEQGCQDGENKVEAAPPPSSLPCVAVRRQAQDTLRRPCDNKNADKADIFCFIGEPVIMTSLAAQAALAGKATCVFGATEGAEAFLGGDDAPLCGEEELQQALREVLEDVRSGRRGSAAVVADPCYREIVPEGMDFHPLPHLAFSGRIFLRDIPDLLRFRL